MATLNPVILKDKAHKDGSHSIRIALRHKSKSVYITTPIKVDSVTQFRGGRVVRRPDATTLNAKLQSLIDSYQERLDDIKHQNVYTVAQLKKLIEKDTSIVGNTFDAITCIYLNDLQSKGMNSHSIAINRACRYFRDYAEGDIILSDITPAMIEGFAESLRERKSMREVSVGTILSHLKAVINRAVKERMVSYKIHPFENVSISPAPVRKLDISLSNFCKIRDAEVYLRNRVVAKDLFLLSFYLGGMNLVDIMQIDFRENVIHYTRSKINNRTTITRTTEITVQPAARFIINKWMDKRTGKLKFGYRLEGKDFASYITYSLKELASEIGVTERVTFYSARKSFAQYACDLCIPDNVIDYCLGHSDKSKGIIRYYTHVSQQKADIAISRVIDYTEHPSEYKDYIEMRNDIMMMRG